MTTTLQEILLAPGTRHRVISDAANLVESEVNAKSGLSGIAIKTGYKAVKAIKPGLIEDAIDGLLDRFVERLEPFYKSWVDGGKSQPFDQFLTGRTQDVANALLGVTDDRVHHTSHKTIKKTYEALRPHGEKNVMAAVPGLGRLISHYV